MEGRKGEREKEGRKGEREREGEGKWSEGGKEVQREGKMY